MVRAFMAGLFMVVLAGWLGGVLFAAVHEPNMVMDTKAGAAVPQPDAATEPAVNAGNTICPVMGGEVSVDSPDKVEYMGKIYNLCCSGCKEEFLKDPEAALKKLAEMEAAAKK